MGDFLLETDHIQLLFFHRYWIENDSIMRCRSTITGPGLSRGVTMPPRPTQVGYDNSDYHYQAVIALVVETAIVYVW